MDRIDFSLCMECFANDLQNLMVYEGSYNNNDSNDKSVTVEFNMLGTGRFCKFKTDLTSDSEEFKELERLRDEFFKIQILSDITDNDLRLKMAKKKLKEYLDFLSAHCDGSQIESENFRENCEYHVEMLMKLYNKNNHD